MKQGWEIKKLGEVCTFHRGLTYSKEDEVEFSNNCVLRSNNIDLDTMTIVLDDLKYINEDFIVSEDKKVKLGTILICMSNGSKQHIGKVAYIDKEYNYAFGGFMGLIKPNDIVYSKYVYYSCISSSYKHFLSGIGNGANITNLKFSDLQNYKLPVPPLPVQEQIVSELDLLSGIIEKKREQLKELDALAQSIFYDMFGDPITNEKGWEVKKLGEVCKVTSFKRVLIEEVVETGIPFIRGTELTALSKLPNSKDYPFTLFITKEHYERVKAISGVPTIGDLLIPSINSEGLIWELDTDEPRYYKDGRVLWVHTNHKYNYSKALKYILSNKLRMMYNELASGATFIELKLFVLRDIELPFPPLPLQHQFASNIEAIERQKELIKQSISETETLFNERMQHYFS